MTKCTARLSLASLLAVVVADCVSIRFHLTQLLRRGCKLAIDRSDFLSLFRGDVIALMRCLYAFVCVHVRYAGEGGLVEQQWIRREARCRVDCSCFNRINIPVSQSVCIAAFRSASAKNECGSIPNACSHTFGFWMWRES